MSANVSLSNKDIDEDISDSESLTDSEKDDCSHDGSVVGERLRGDGQEQDALTIKKIDDDEDRRNPQYIPKRGNFYEHDDRTLEDVDNSNDESTDKGDKIEKDTPRSRKKVWEEKDGEKWGHDLYIEKEQQPKTKQELINAYGYDIRNEDGPPRARRRRRYGRGPNKYTRNWEDEEAYSRAHHSRPRKNPKNLPTKEDFPPLNNEKRSRSMSPNRNRIFTISHNSKNLDDSMINNKKERFRRSRSEKSWKKTSKKFGDDKKEYRENNIPIQNKILPSDRPTKSKSSRKLQDPNQYPPPPPTNKSQSMNSNHTKNQKVGPNTELNIIKSSSSKHRQQDTDNIVSLTKISPITSQSYSNSNRNKQNISTMTENIVKNDTYENLTKEVANMKIDSQQTGGVDNIPQVNNTNSTNNMTRQASVPPRLQSEQQRMGPKRYSSLRQRSLPETTPQTFVQPHTTGYYQQEYPNQNQQQTEPPTHSIHPQIQISPNTQQSLMMNQISNQTMINAAQATQNPPSVMGIPMSHSNAAQVHANHITSGQPPTVQAQPASHHQQLLSAHGSMMAAAAHAQQTQVSHHQQLLNAQPIITHALPQSAAHQPILTQAQGLSPQTQAMLSAQSQQLLTAQTHPQYGAPQAYQVPNAGSANAVYNIQQAVTAGTTAYIPPQPTAVINSVYGAAPPGAQHPPQYTPTPYPAYQQTFTAPPGQATQDLYQSQGGITYYSPHNQPTAPRAPLKRPKAAIPILAPPERTATTAPPRGRGRSSPTENSDTKTTEPRGRGRISPTLDNAGDNNLISRGRGRKMSNEMNSTDLNATSETGSTSSQQENVVENVVISSSTTNIGVDQKFVENAVNDNSSELNVQVDHTSTVSTLEKNDEFAQKNLETDVNSVG